MRIIDFQVFMAAAGWDLQALRTLRRRGQVALAFGRSDVYASLSYIELDAVAACLADDLAQSFDRTFAAQLVRVHCDEWAASVARAETSPTPTFFAVIEYEPVGRAKGKRSHLVCSASTPDAQQIALAASLTPQAASYEVVRVVIANISRIVARVRENAKRAGFDLSDPFLPPPDSPQFKAIFKSYSEIRDHAVASVMANRKDKADLARRAGLLARATVEASVDEPKIVVRA